MWHNGGQCNIVLAQGKTETDNDDDRKLGIQIHLE